MTWMNSCTGTVQTRFLHDLDEQQYSCTALAPGPSTAGQSTCWLGCHALLLLHRVLLCDPPLLLLQAV
jgi:hypothetical protein